MMAMQPREAAAGSGRLASEARRFLKHDVWVTAFAPAERYAGGEYMCQSRGNDGLLTWRSGTGPSATRTSWSG